MVSRLVSPAAVAACCLGSFLFAGGCAVPRTSGAALVVPPPALAADAAPKYPKVGEEQDEPGAAAEFFLQKRSPDGAPIETARIRKALEHASRMPRHVTGRASSAAPPRGAKAAGGADRSVAIGTWSELGPGNYGGRVRSLAMHPGNPDTIWAGAVSGGVWKTTDGGATWKAIADLMPNIAISALALDAKNSDTIYAGTGEGFSNYDAVRGGGIFKSTDGGATWTLLEGTVNNSNFYYTNKIVVSPVDSQRVYAATNTGLFRSRDGGATFAMVLDRTLPHRGCHDLVIRSDQATDYLFAACGVLSDRAEIFRNQDASGEGKWESVYTETDMSRTTLALAPSNQAIIYALASSRESGEKADAMLAVFRSTSNGDPDTWEARVRNTDPVKLNTGLLSNGLRLFAPECGIGKQAWLNQGWYDNVIAVDPADPEKVWAGGVDLFRSDDGGANWGVASFWWASTTNAKLVHADVHAIVFHPGYDGGSNQSMFAATDGGIYRTDNARADTGTSPAAYCNTGNSSVRYKSLNNGFNAFQFYHGAVYPGGRGYFGGAQDNGVALGGDATGFTWSTLLGGDGGYAAVDPSNVNRIFAENPNLSLVRSTDGGFTYRGVTTGIDEPASNFPFITPFAVDPNASNRLWIGGQTLWRTADYGDSWNAASAPVETGQITSVAVAPGNSDRVLFGTTKGRVYRSNSATGTDNSASWDYAVVRAPATASGRAYVSSINFDPASQDVVYATITTYKVSDGDAHVYKSTDGGVSWAAIDGAGSTGLPDVPVNTLVVGPDSPSTLYIGTDNGVFVTLDGGGTWAREDAGFASVRTDLLTLDRSPAATTLFAFTHGRGVWRVPLAGDPAACQIKVPSSVTSVAYGGRAAVAVEAPDGCRWSALKNSASIDIEAPAMGTGGGALGVNVPLNTGTASRSFSLMVADQAVRIVQDAPQNLGLGSTNNEVSSARTIGTTLPWAGVADTRTATSASSDPVHSCTAAADSHTVWYRFHAASSGTLVITSESNLRYDTGRSWTPVLAAYPADNVGAELACDSKTSRASIRFDVTENNGYVIGLGAADAGSPGGYIVLSAAWAQ
jgi:hypothetical protein